MGAVAADAASAGRSAAQQASISGRCCASIARRERSCGKSRPWRASRGLPFRPATPTPPKRPSPTASACTPISACTACSVTTSTASSSGRKTWGLPHRNGPGPGQLARARRRAALPANRQRGKIVLGRAGRENRRRVVRVSRDEETNHCSPVIWKNKQRTRVVTSGSHEVRSTNRPPASFCGN